MELLTEAFAELVKRWDPILPSQRDALGLELYGDLVDIRERFWGDGFTDLHGKKRRPKRKSQTAQEARTTTFIQGNQVAALVTQHLDKWKNKMCLSSEPGISIGNGESRIVNPHSSLNLNSYNISIFAANDKPDILWTSVSRDAHFYGGTVLFKVSLIASD